MNEVEQNLANWGNSLCTAIPVGSLLDRNAIVYKWKSLYRVWMLRELAFWREYDLMTQSYLLHKQGHALGARILLRSGFETLGTLIYVNMLMQQVLDGKLNFHLFGEKTSLLLLGSRNNKEMPTAINVVTILGKANKRYPGLTDLYADLSESAHPNYEGLMGGYSTTNYNEYETTFANLWVDLHGDRHLHSMMLCIETFHHEYHEVWPDLIERFESWVEVNDATLEATKNDPSLC